jgi:phage tail-like protein
VAFAAGAPLVDARGTAALLASEELEALPPTGRAAELLQLTDPAGDIYHPLGPPGFVGGNVDITSVFLSIFGVEELDISNPFERGRDGVDSIRRDGPDWDFPIAGPYLVAEIELALDIDYSEALFCEYIVGFGIPGRDAFSGIEGDLFNTNNYVQVVRTGLGGTNGFEVRALEYTGGGWPEMAPHGAAAGYMNRMVFAIPASEFGEGGSAMRTAMGSFLQGDEAAESVLDFNFGAFCSEGGQSFDPALGGADILQAPVDLAGLPVFSVGPTAPPQPEPTTTTTADDGPTTTTGGEPPTPSTTAAPATGEGGGASPALIALIAGGVGAVAYAASRVARSRSHGDPAGPRAGFRVEIEGVGGASFSEVAGLGLEATGIDYRDGISPDTVTRLPGLQKHTNLVMRGGTDLSPEFVDWVRGERRGPGVSGSITLEVTGSPALQWNFRDGWPAKWEGPTFSGKSTETAMESLELTVEQIELKVGP